jgi:rod shape-determining protein MreC
MKKIFSFIVENKHHALFISCTLISFSLLFTDASTKNVELFRSRVIDIFSSLYKPVTWIKYSYTLDKENTLLREKVLQLSLQVSSMQFLESENQRLQNLLSFQRENQLTLLPSKVINKGILPNINSLTIDVGKKAGVLNNDPVLTPKGVIGKVLISGETSSMVQLIKDINYRLSVRILPNGSTGILRWYGNNKCQIREVQKNALVRVGDGVVTSGFSNIYPKDLPVGTVSGIIDKMGSFEKIILVQITEDIESLLDVFVVLGESNVSN